MFNITSNILGAMNTIANMETADIMKANKKDVEETYAYDKTTKGIVSEYVNQPGFTKNVSKIEKLRQKVASEGKAESDYTRAQPGYKNVAGNKLYDEGIKRKEARETKFRKDIEGILSKNKKKQVPANAVLDDLGSRLQNQFNTQQMGGRYRDIIRGEYEGGIE